MSTGERRRRRRSASACDLRRRRRCASVLHAEVDVDAELLDGAAQDVAAARVDLARHQARRELDDVGLEPEVAHRLRRLEAEQAAADHRRAPRAAPPRRGSRRGPRWCGRRRRPASVDAGDRRHERRGAGGEHERVVGDARVRAPVTTARAARSIATTRSPRWSVDAALGVPDDVRELRGRRPCARRRTRSGARGRTRGAAPRRTTTTCQRRVASSSARRSQKRCATMPLPTTTSVCAPLHRRLVLRHRACFSLRSRAAMRCVRAAVEERESATRMPSRDEQDDATTAAAGRRTDARARRHCCPLAGHAAPICAARWLPSREVIGGMIETKQLQIFKTIVEVGSFTGAGEELGLSQPAISQQIRALEEEVGVPLLVRLGRSTRMTPAGEVLLQCARQVLEQDRRDAALSRRARARSRRRRAHRHARAAVQLSAAARCWSS